MFTFIGTFTSVDNTDSVKITVDEVTDEKVLAALSEHGYEFEGEQFEIDIDSSSISISDEDTGDELYLGIDE